MRKWIIICFGLVGLIFVGNIHAQEADAVVQSKVPTEQQQHISEDTDSSAHKAEWHPKNQKEQVLNISFSGALINQGFDTVAARSSANLWTGSLGVEIYPETLGIKFSYGGTLQTKLLRKDYYDDFSKEDVAYDESMKDAEFIYLLVPIAKTEMGDFSFEYKKSNYITEIFDENNTGIHILDYAERDPAHLGNELILANDDTYRQYDRMYVGILNEQYVLNYSYAPFYDAGFSLIYEQGKRPLAFGDQHLAADPEYMGVKISMGMVKSKEALPEGFSIRLLRLSYMPYTYEFLRYDTHKKFEGDAVEEALEAELSYKMDSAYVGFYASRTWTSNESAGMVGEGATYVDFFALGLFVDFKFNAI